MLLDSATILHSALNNADYNLGQIDFEAAQNEVETIIQSKKKRGTYAVYTPKERFEIGKYAVENGTSKAVSRYKSRFPSLKESTVRGFQSKYENEKTAVRSNLLSTKGTTNFTRANRWYCAELYEGQYIFILILIN